MTRLLTLDIETTTPRGVEADFEDLSCWRLFAIAVGFRPSPDAPVDTTVLIRQGNDEQSERRLLAQLVNWVRNREPIDVVAGYNSKDFDMPILEQRADELLKSDRPHEQSLSFALHSALNAPHRDLFAEIKAGLDEDERWPTLDASLSQRGITAASTTLEGSEVSGKDMPRIGRAILDGEANPDERRALVEYARSDVAPLFELADALDRERQAAAEADVVTDGGRS